MFIWHQWQCCSKCSTAFCFLSMSMKWKRMFCDYSITVCQKCMCMYVFHVYCLQISAFLFVWSSQMYCTEGRIFKEWAKGNCITYYNEGKTINSKYDINYDNTAKIRVLMMQSVVPWTSLCLSFSFTIFIGLLTLTAVNKFKKSTLWPLLDFWVSFKPQNHDSALTGALS